MQKYYKSAALMLAAMLSVSMYSCKDSDSNEETDITAPINAVDPSESEAMSAEAQKEYIEKVAIELAEKVPASDFEDLFTYLMGLTQHLGQYSAKELSEWSYNALQSMRTVLSAGEFTEEYSTETADRVINYSYKTSKLVLALSAFTGHLSVKDNKWVCEEADDLQFTFVDQNGDNCTIKLETSGDVKTVHLTNDYEGDWTIETDYSGEKPVITEYETSDTTIQCVSLPENVKATFVREGLTLATLKCNFNLSDLEGEEFNLQKSNLSSSALFELANGYKAEVINLTYQAEKKATAALRLSKNNEALVTLTLNTGVKFPSVLLSQLNEEEPADVTRAEDLELEDEEEPTFWDEAQLKNLTVKLDVLGKVQVQGTISDFIKLYALQQQMHYIDMKDDKARKAMCENLNLLFDMGIFYDGKNAKQAIIKLYTFNRGSVEAPRWVFSPVIKFADQTTYSEVVNFFNAENFAKALEAWGKTLGEYQAFLPQDQE